MSGTTIGLVAVPMDELEHASRCTWHWGVDRTHSTGAWLCPWYPLEAPLSFLLGSRSALAISVLTTFFIWRLPWIFESEWSPYHPQSATLHGSTFNVLHLTFVF